MTNLTIRNVEIEGRPGLDAVISSGRVAEIGPGLSPVGAEIDGAGGALLPGLIDHHLHLFALAASLLSVPVGPESFQDTAAFATALNKADQALAKGQWLRGAGYHESVAGELDRFALDRFIQHRPVRIQHRSGAMWMLNSAALKALAADVLPAGAERDAYGAPTGRFWREDVWLRSHMPTYIPTFDVIGSKFESFGITGVTDASVSTDNASAAILSKAVRKGEIRVRLNLMSGGPLTGPADGSYRIGAVKILLDEAALDDFDFLVGQIAFARELGRNVAIHCVTAGELAYALAAFREAGAEPGDRIEHGAIIDNDAAMSLKELGLTVVTQPSFIAERGDDYLAEVDLRDHSHLYRLARLISLGIPVAGSSDAPYASLDPWSAMRAAIHRATPKGRTIGAGEALDARAALGLYLGSFDDPGGTPRRVIPGAMADLCLARVPMRVLLGELSSELVRGTIIGGKFVELPD